MSPHVDVMGEGVSVHTLVFAGNLVLLDARRQQISFYNEAARFVWEELRVGQTADEIAESLHRHGRIDLTPAEESVRALVDHWNREGLLVSARPAEIAAAGTGLDWRSAPQPVWAARWRLQIRDVCIDVAIENPELVDPARRLLRELETSTGPATVRIELRTTSSGDAALLVDGIEQCRMSHPGSVKDNVHHAIRSRAWPDVDWLALIHGGAVARDGRAILLPADSGSGKTTLIAYLIQQGFDYLADDTIALRAPGGELVPWPVPLSVKDGSLSTLRPVYPELDEIPTFGSRESRARLLPPTHCNWDSPPVPVQAIVFPRYRIGAETRTETLEPIGALRMLSEARFWPAHPISAERLQYFLDWLERTPAFVLEYESLVEAAAVVSRLSSVAP